MGNTSIGAEVRRNEDRRLVTGRGQYTADVNLPGQAFARVVRSPHAHATVRGIDVSAAFGVEGVLQVLTGAELMSDGLGSLIHDFGLLGSIEAQKAGPDIYLENRDGSPSAVPPHHLLAIDRVRYVGEAVAIVIAESVEAAREAADLVLVDYDELPVVVRASDATDPGAPRVWDHIPRNISIDAEVGDKQATDAAFARAAHVVRLQTVIQRITGVPMEPRATVAQYDASNGRYTVHAGCTGVIRFKMELAAILRVSPEKVRVISRDVGGSFGTRNAFYVECGLLAWASRKLGRPIKWVSDRLECFMSDYQGRDLTVEAELALDSNGRFLALRGINTSNIGAYASSHIPLRKGIGLMPGVYDIPAAHFIARGVFTNTKPTTPVRSAGRPEAIFVIERLVDLAARKLAMDPIAIRRLNLIRPESLPYRNAVGLTYDNGEYEAVMDEALRLADWNGFPRRKAQASTRGKLRGIGVANYIEITTGPPVERAEVSVLPNGQVEIVIGTVSTGQGHETSFAQLITEWLGIPVTDVRLLAGDTDRLLVGGGSVSGRSMRFAGVVIGKAVDEINARCREITAHLLGVPQERVKAEKGRYFDPLLNGGFTVVELACIAQDDAGRIPEALRGRITGVGQEHFKAAGFPYGSQVCEVEIDPETGATRIVTLAAVDDVGRAINPMILHGQTHGGAAMAIGQALMEKVHYDVETGQLLTGSFMDYPMPRAKDLPFFQVGLSEVLSPSNPLGIRAGGEGGTTPTLGVVVNAIVDALKDFGVTHLEMPVTAQAVWNAIHKRKWTEARVGESYRSATAGAAK